MNRFCLLVSLGGLLFSLSACTSAPKREAQVSPQPSRTPSGTGSVGSGGGPSAVKTVSTYTRVNDKESCRYSESREDDGVIRGKTYDCSGPVEGISTSLLTGDDWDNLTVNINGKSYSTWHYMVKVGSFAGVGNNKGIIEWIGRPQSKGFTDPTALIVRFNGTRDDRAVSRLVVFGIENEALCYKGVTANNEEARRIAINTPCSEKIEPEAKD